MKAIKYFSCIVLLVISSRIYSQIPDTIWTKTFGGSLADVGNSVKQTNDGGFIVAATTSSFGAGGQDIYLIKTDENGDTLWTKTFGGTGNDRASNVVQTNDNGYAVFGTTNSFGNGGNDFLFWKTDSLGITEWYKTFGSTTEEEAYEGKQLEDGSYVIVGDSIGQNPKAWLVKTDGTGNLIWGRTIGTSIYGSYYWGRSVLQTNDGGYVMCGAHRYVYYPYWAYEYSFTKISPIGDSLFYRYYGMSGYAFCNVVKELSDGNLLLGGTINDMNLNYRIWILKVTQSGNVIWQNTLVGNYPNLWLTSLEPTMDDCLIIAARGSGEFHILKADEFGNLNWEESIGGPSLDDAYSIYLTSDNGYIVTGETKSFGAGDSDIWLVKFKYNPSPEIQISKDSLNLTFDDISFTSRDSLVIYNTGNATLNVDTIYSTNASGFLLDIVLNDTTIHTSVTWRNSYSSPFELESNDSAKLIFTYPLWIPKSKNITETWQDTVIILNNSLNNSSLAIPTVIDFPVGISNESNDLPLKFSLSQNYPNPFNPLTSIQYAVSIRHFVTLKVYDVLGNEIATLVNEEKQPGVYEIELNVTSHSGEVRNLSSGIYFYQLKAGNYIETKKMVLIK